MERKKGKGGEMTITYLVGRTVRFSSRDVLTFSSGRKEDDR